MEYFKKNGFNNNFSTIPHLQKRYKNALYQQY